MSDSARFVMKIFVMVCMDLFLVTTNMTKEFPLMPTTKIMA